LRAYAAVDSPLAVSAVHVGFMQPVRQARRSAACCVRTMRRGARLARSFRWGPRVGGGAGSAPRPVFSPSANLARGSSGCEALRVRRADASSGAVGVESSWHLARRIPRRRFLVRLSCDVRRRVRRCLRAVSSDPSCVHRRFARGLFGGSLASILRVAWCPGGVKGALAPQRWSRARGGRCASPRAATEMCVWARSMAASWADGSVHVGIRGLGGCRAGR